MGPRRKAREYALQMLFQWDITRDSIDQIAATFFNGQDEEPGVIAFARQLVIQTVEHVEEIDALIQRHAERSEEHTSELQSRLHLVCRLLLEKKKTYRQIPERSCVTSHA